MEVVKPDTSEVVSNAKLENVKAVTKVEITVNRDVDGNTVTEKHSLKYDMNAFSELEKEYGTIDKALSKAGEPSFKDIIFFLWAGILHDNAVLDEDGELVSYKVSRYDVGSWFTPSELKPVTEKIWTTIARDLRTEEAAGKNE